jgi:signal transduction histidine kinase/ActR/RegA family two-component response regulator
MSLRAPKPLVAPPAAPIDVHRVASVDAPAAGALGVSLDHSHNRPFRLRWAALGVAIGACTAVLLWWLASVPARQAEGELLRLTQAEFASAPEGPWATVELPDTWARREASSLERGYYRLRVQKPSNAERMHALEFERLALAHELRLNGALLHGVLDRANPQRRPAPAVMAVPPALWKEGDNLIEIASDGGARAGLSTVRLGEFVHVEKVFQSRRMTREILPQALNAAAAGLSLFALLTWWQRRKAVSEDALLYFAAIGLVASLRNLAYVLVQTQVPRHVSDALLFLLQVLSVVWLGLFCLSYSGAHVPRFKQALKTLGLAAVPAAVLVSQTGWVEPLRQYVYPLLMVVVLISLGIVAHTALTRRRRLDVGLMLCVAMLLGVGVHDYLYQQGHTSVMGGFWLVYALPVFILVFSMALLRSVADALAQVEHLNLVLERRVAERTHELEQVTRAKERFLAAASHDLRQPLFGIGLEVALLNAQPLQAEARAHVGRLQLALQGMDRMFGQLLDFSRLESTQIKVQLQACSLADLFAEIAHHHAVTAQAKGLELHLRPGARWVMADPVLLEQVVRNLVANAIRYTVRGHVWVGARYAGSGQVRIEVRDTGPGIPAEKQRAIFSEFTRFARVVRSEPAGIGLGLSIARRSAKLMNTHLMLTSEVGCGTCFRVTLPDATPHPNAARTAFVHDTRETPVAHEIANLNLRASEVWVLEDQQLTRMVLCDLFGRWNARVRAFSNAAELEQHMSQSENLSAPSFVLSDLHLPDRLGSDLARSLRLRWPSLPILILTADRSASTQDCLESLARDGVDSLRKPALAPDLARAVAVALGRAPASLQP